MALYETREGTEIGEMDRFLGSYDDPWVEVQRYAGRAQAERHALVLAAVGIDCRLVPEPGAVALLVPEADALRARSELAAYARENRRPRPSPLGRPLAQGVDGALAYCALLVYLFSASRRHAFALDWWSAGAAQAGLILAGEWWRALTSLGLHADLGHLGANLLFGSLFGLLVAQRLGAGLAWLAILLAAGLGNGLNALLRDPAHTAVGASTAVFAALGMLAALTWRYEASRWRFGLRRWAPLAAGVMLLAFLGFSGERTDVGAHVAGFAVGTAFGAGLAQARGQLPQGLRAQLACGAAALSLLGLAWLAAFRAHG